jgi:hypothetical protein
MKHFTRREWLASAACTLAAPLLAQVPGDRPVQDKSVKVLNPQGRAPVTFIIDDSTCLVNLNRFAIPQFDAAFGEKSNYKHDWRKMPVEIPDAFVRKFGEWCAERHIKGKYSVIPYPACVGRLDRELPGWTPKEVANSIKLVRDLMVPSWDIHPEMVTHTRAIDIKTGHPYPQRTLEFMENWEFSTGKSVDQLAEYLAYALRILKNVGLPCEGITTPGGFGNRVKGELSQAVGQSVRDVFGTEIPHYFKYIIDKGTASVAPKVEYASIADPKDSRCVVNMIACTGDWTGGWDCSDRGHLDRFITEDLKEGRVVEVIDRGEPACLFGHWTGIYWNGEELGFKIFQEVVRRMHRKYDNLLWMKTSELARYWAAKELTRIEKMNRNVLLRAPFACPAFTLKIADRGEGAPKLGEKSLTEVKRMRDLKSGVWLRDGDGVVVCFDLPKGKSVLTV